ncbi:glycosyltransferase family 39 protein [Adhaeribacter sp. BT258]|uniref:Glycosyltransferase family 39 protein n=1 Tax=Adhaeribacter terrigena TaxID=2793070 RepID=A0ABS1C6U1_9BACT|nr:glycosyltransferase family 39 protein [Adhaeribacter terrigena]MBK0404418.1 glycosyltransferase family 39 protein [Adhaeribacter terrigena]
MRNIFCRKRKFAVTSQASGFRKRPQLLLMLLLNKLQNFSKNEPLLARLALLVGCVFTVLYFFFAHEGSYFNDDWAYSRYAHEVLTGDFAFEYMPFSHRFFAYLPVSILYATIGVSPYITTVWPMLCTAGTLVLIFGLLRKNYPGAAMWAVILLGFNFHTLFLSNYLYPDNVVMLLALAILGMLLHYRQVQNNPIRFGLAFAVLNFLGMLTKETIIYIAPVYLYVFVLDLIRKENLKFWLWSAVFGAILLAFYFAAYEIFTGHWLNRFLMTSEIVNEFKPGYLQNKTAYYFNRLTYEPILFFIGSGIIVPIIFAFSAPGVTLKNLVKLENTRSYWLLATILILLTFWFGSTSYTHYKPMVLVPRMITVLMPPLCISAGFALANNFHKPRFQLIVGVFFLAAAVISRSNLAVIYVPVGLFFLFVRFVPKFALPVFGLLVIMFSLAIRPLHFMVKPTGTDYFVTQELMTERLNHKAGRYQVFTNYYLAQQYCSFYGYQPNPNYEYLNYDKTRQVSASADTAYLLVNQAMIRNPELMLRLQADSVYKLFPKRELLWQKGNVQLFMLPKIKE